MKNETAVAIAQIQTLLASNPWDLGPTWDDADGYIGGAWEDCQNPF